MKGSIKKSDSDIKKIKKVSLFCGQGRDTSFLNPDGFSTEPQNPRPDSARIAEITVDARGMDKPVIEIEFTCIINLLAFFTGPKGSISFLLFRDCDNGEPKVVNSWPYEVFDIETSNTDMRLTTSFAFTFCECLNRPDCYKYFVEVFAGGLTRANIVINNINIAALASESCG